MRKDITKLLKTIYNEPQFKENHFKLNLEDDSYCDLTIVQHVNNSIYKEESNNNSLDQLERGIIQQPPELKDIELE